MTEGFDLDELERLLAAATPGEWRVDGARGKFSRINPNGQFHGVGPDGDAVAAVFYDTETGLGFMDAKLIVALHNSASAMIAEIRELRDENARLREALETIRDRKWNTMTQGCDAAAEAAQIAGAALTGEPQ